MTSVISFRNAYWFLVGCGALYFAFISLLTVTPIQRHMLYLHKLRTTWWQDPSGPEQFGFLKNQVRPFELSTPDGETLYAWHVLPIAKYIANEEAILNDPVDSTAHIEDTVGFALLSKDPTSRLVINFHGNAGSVAQGWRTDTYRALASGAADKIHVLAMDYRGFGYSTGSPEEQGLISDGIAAVHWAMNVARIPPDRIALVGQSLGTAVAAAVAEHFARVSQTEFAGLVLVAPFSDIPTLLLTYSIGGIIPILSPLRPYPALQKVFLRLVKETWQTSSRITNLVRQSRKVNLHLIHSKTDFEISWQHSESLFYAAANATSPSGMSIKQIDAVKFRQDLGEGGFVESWNAGHTKKISKHIVYYGGHNRLATYPCVTRAIQQVLGCDASK